MAPNSSQMIALLGLLAVAGYQNRDKLRDWFNGMNRDEPQPADQRTMAPADQRQDNNEGGLLGGLLGGLGNLFGDRSPREVISGGLRDLVDRFDGNGHGDEARSWVQDGPNRQMGASELQDALGADAIDALTRQTGLSREDLLERLRTVLPSAVDTMTPDGRLPHAA